MYSQLMNIAAVVKLILTHHMKTARQHAVNLHQVHATLSIACSQNSLYNSVLLPTLKLATIVHII